MFWFYFFVWLFSTIICWVLYWICDEAGSNWVITLQDHNPLDIVICSTPVVNSLFLVFLIVSTAWKLLRLSFFNKSFYTQTWEIIKEIWNN